MRSTFDEQEARAICVDPTWAELQKRLHACGLHKTAQELNKVTQTMGWELAEMEKTMSHTPGPWRIERRHDGVPFGISAPETMTSDTDVLVSFGNNPNIESNATLIAAAPDLLAALYAFVDPKRWTATTDREELGRRHAAHAAIEKATGTPFKWFE